MAEEPGKKFTSVLLLALAVFLVVRVLYPPVINGGAVLSGAGGLNPSQSRKVFEELGGAATEKPVLMFVTSWCPVCRALENELKSRGVKYVLADIEQNQSAFYYYQKITRGQTSGVPVTLAGTEVILGYAPEAIERALSRF